MFKVKIIKRILLKWYYFYTGRLYLGLVKDKVYCFFENEKWILKSDIKNTFTKSEISTTTTNNK